MITKEGIKLLQLMHLRKVFTSFAPVANNIVDANKCALEIIDMTNADNYGRTIENSKQYLATLVAVGTMAKLALNSLDSFDKLD